MKLDHIRPRLDRTGTKRRRWLAVTGFCLVLTNTGTWAQDRIPLGEVASGQLKEISGIAVSRRHPGVLWVVNDGPDGRLFAVGTNGQAATVLKLDTAVIDIEDLAMGTGPVGENPQLYVGDIGDNEGRRRSIRVYRLPEPELRSDTSPKQPALITAFDTMTLRYPDAAHDAEALLSDPRTGDLLVVTKQKRKARAYVAAAALLTDRAQVTLQFLREVPFADVSGGDMSAQGDRILLRRENAAFIWERGPGETVGVALGTSPRRVAVVGPPDEPNGESIAWHPDGGGYYTLSEGKRQPIYYFPLGAPSP